PRRCRRSEDMPTSSARVIGRLTSAPKADAALAPIRKTLSAAHKVSRVVADLLVVDVCRTIFSSQNAVSRAPRVLPTQGATSFGFREAGERCRQGLFLPFREAVAAI